MTDLDTLLEDILPNSEWHRFTDELLEGAGVSIESIKKDLEDKGRGLGIPVIVDVVSTPSQHDLRVRIDYFRVGTE